MATPNKLKQPAQAPAHARNLTIDEYCTEYGGRRNLAYKAIMSGDLGSIKVGGRRLIPRTAAEARQRRLEEEAGIRVDGSGTPVVEHAKDVSKAASASRKREK